MKSLYLGSFLVFAGLSAHATFGLSPKVLQDRALTKYASSEAKMSEAGHSVQSQFDLVHSLRDDSQKFTWHDGSSSGFLMTQDNGRTGLIHTLVKDADGNGSLEQTAISIPSTLSEPTRIQIYASGNDRDITVRRVFQRSNGVTTISEKMNVGQIGGREIRIMREFDIDSPSASLSVASHGDRLQVAIKSPNANINWIDILYTDLKGAYPVQFKVSSDGRLLNVITASRNGEFQVVDFEITSGAKGKSFEKKEISRRTMTGSELEASGILIHKKTIAGKTPSSSTASGMEVESNVGGAK